MLKYVKVLLNPTGLWAPNLQGSYTAGERHIHVRAYTWKTACIHSHIWTYKHAHARTHTHTHTHTHKGSSGEDESPCPALQLSAFLLFPNFLSPPWTSPPGKPLILTDRIHFLSVHGWRRPIVHLYVRVGVRRQMFPSRGPRKEMQWRHISCLQNCFPFLTRNTL